MMAAKISRDPSIPLAGNSAGSSTRRPAEARHHPQISPTRHKKRARAKEFPEKLCWRAGFRRGSIFARRFHLLEKRVKLAHRKARYESSYRPCEETPRGFGLGSIRMFDSRPPFFGATLATSDKNNPATRCTSNRSTTWQPADASELQRRVAIQR